MSLLNMFSKVGFVSALVLTGLTASPAPLRADAPVSDGRQKIVFTSSRDGNNEIYVIDADGTHETRLTNNPADDWMACISPDGNKVLWSTNRDGGGHEIYEMNIDGSSPTRLTFDGSDDLQPMYSPNGTRIAFSANRWGADYDVAFMNRNGGDVQRATSNQLGDYHATFNPSSNEFAFVTFYGNTYIPQITKIQTSGTGQQQLTTLGQNHNPSWSSQDVIAFSSDRDGNQEIYTMLPDGTNQVNVTGSAGFESDPTWSPNGQKLAFTSDRSGSNQILVANANGSDATPITTAVGGNSDPFWGPATNTNVVPVLTVSNCSVVEGNSGEQTATFTVNLLSPSADPVTVHYATADYVATSPADFTAKSGDLTFAPGETEKTVSVAVNGDTLDEFDEQFILNLTDLVGATLGVSQGTATIVDDDAAPSLSINNKTITEGNSGTQDIVFTVTLSAPSGRAVSVGYNVVHGTTNSSDFSNGPGSGTVSIPAGETIANIALPVVGDTLYELDETFEVVLTQPANASLPSGFLYNPLNKHYYQLVTDAEIVWADARTAAEARTLGGVSGHLVTVTSAGEKNALNVFNAGFHMGGFQPDGSPEPGGNWQWVTGEPFTYTNWNSGEPNNLGGGLDENILTSAINNTWNDATATYKPGAYLVEYDTTGPVEGVEEIGGHGVILNDDTVPVISIGDASVTEGNSGGTDMVFNATLSAPSSATVSAGYQVANITTTAADFEGSGTGVVTFVPGETYKSIVIRIQGDTTYEKNDSFELQLLNPVNATLAPEYVYNPVNKHHYKLIKDPSLDWEGARDDAKLRSLSGKQGHLVTITSASEKAGLAAFDGLPFHIGGYQPAGSEEPAGGWRWVTNEPFVYTSWNPGEPNNAGEENVMQAAIHSNWNDARSTDKPGAYLVEFDTTAAVTDYPYSSGHGVILNDDDQPSISVSDLSLAESTYGKAFELRLSKPTEVATTVDVVTQSGTATAGQDFVAVSKQTVAFKANTLVFRVSAQPQNDRLDEDDETFKLLLSNPTGATLANTFATATILDDDPAPMISITADVSHKEGNTGTTPFVYNVLLTSPSGHAITVNYATVDLTAKSTSDYIPISGTLTFASGETSKTLTVAVKGDTASETNEQFAVILSAPTRATIRVERALGTIVNDDDENDSTPPPPPVITSPAPGSIVQKLPFIRGTATNVPVLPALDRVEVKLKRNADGLYWDGTAWAAAQATLPATINGLGWIYNGPLPTPGAANASAKLTDGLYTVTCNSVDRGGNRSTAFSVFRVDNGLPTMTIVTPANGSTVQTLPAIKGTAADTVGGSGIERVEAYLRRQLPGSAVQYWGLRDGAYGWGSNILYLPAKLSGENWSIAKNAPVGVVLPTGDQLLPATYAVAGRVFDKAGNNALSLKNTFTLAAPAPAAVAGTPVSNVALSAAVANAAQGTVTLTFAGNISTGSAGQAGNYTVSVNGEAVEIESVSVKQNTVVLGLAEGALTAGPAATVNYDLLDAGGARITGTATAKIR